MKKPFDKIKILWWQTIALEKSFPLIYSNTHLNSHETVPLKFRKYDRLVIQWGLQFKNQKIHFVSVKPPSFLCIVLILDYYFLLYCFVSLRLLTSENPPFSLLIFLGEKVFPTLLLPNPLSILSSLISIFYFLCLTKIQKSS